MAGRIKEIPGLISICWRILKRICRDYLLPACPSCGEGRIHYLGEDWTGRVWISVHECDRCGKWWV